MRMGIEFSKSGMAKYISHLDLQRAFGRAIRRSGLPVSLSQGFNPHYVISFASALALGMQSEAECVEMVLSQDIKPELFMFALNNSLPKGLRANRAAVLSDKAPKLMAAVREAHYSINFRECDFNMLKTAVCDIMGKSSIIAIKTSKGRQKEIDIRPLILGLELEHERLTMRLASAPTGSLKPEYVIEQIIKRIGQHDYEIARTGLYAHIDGKSVNLLDACAI